MTLRLPKPTRTYHVPEQKKEEKNIDISKIVTKEIPAYRNRNGYMPRVPEDFADGGAFPEIHVAQYPLGMGMRSAIVKKATVALTTDSTGKLQYDAIVKQGTNSGQIVKSSMEDVIPKNAHRDENPRLNLPGVSEEDEAAEKTKAALDRIVTIKTQGAQAVQRPDHSRANESIDKPVYIKYSDSASKDRVIRMVEAPVDPLEPPKFKHKKVARGSAADPVPILRAPAKKLTAEDQEAWKIPACVSNWKNPQGFTIPLDKRLAADGRGLLDNTINDKFAKLSEALYIAENQARAEVEARNAEKVYLLQKSKEKREEELRELAAEARRNQAETSKQHRQRSSSSDSSSGSESSSGDSRRSSDNEEDTEARERDAIRRERKRQRERDLRLAAAGKKTKLARDDERDVSERIALGMAVPKNATASAESQFDARLFNQTQGMDAGFGDESDYNVYSKPLVAQRSTKQYNPKGAGDGMTDLESFEKIKSQSSVQFEKNPY